MRDWFEPLMEQADLTCVGINGRVLLDRDIQRVVLDFQRRQVIPDLVTALEWSMIAVDFWL